MLADRFALNPLVAAGSRIRMVPATGANASARPTVRELAILIVAGAAAAATVVIADMGLRIPGHAILRGVLFMALGIALVPRRMAGLVMGASAMGTAGLLSLGLHAGAGSLTSLLLLGPTLDLALWAARRSWQVPLAFGAAGLAANAGAFAVQAGLKASGFAIGSGKPLAVWLPTAIVSYTICGLVAGLVSGAICFRFRPKAPRTAKQD